MEKVARRNGIENQERKKTWKIEKGKWAAIEVEEKKEVEKKVMEGKKTWQDCDSKVDAGWIDCIVSFSKTLGEPIPYPDERMDAIYWEAHFNPYRHTKDNPVLSLLVYINGLLKKPFQYDIDYDISTKSWKRTSVDGSTAGFQSAKDAVIHTLEEWYENEKAQQAEFDKAMQYSSAKKIHEKIQKKLADAGFTQDNIPPSLWMWCERGWQGGRNSLEDVKSIVENRCYLDSLHPYGPEEQKILNTVCQGEGILPVPKKIGKSRRKPLLNPAQGQYYTVEQLRVKDQEPHYLQRALGDDERDLNRWRSVRRLPTREWLKLNDQQLNDLVPFFKQYSPLQEPLEPCVRKQV